MSADFFERAEKAGWGIPCNQSADGLLWVGKGYECPLDGQLGAEVGRVVTQALEEGRGDRCGRFWVNLTTKTVTMQVGPSDSNQVQQASF